MDALTKAFGYVFKKNQENTTILTQRTITTTKRKGFNGGPKKPSIVAPVRFVWLYYPYRIGWSMQTHKDKPRQTHTDPRIHGRNHKQQHKPEKSATLWTLCFRAAVTEKLSLSFLTPGWEQFPLPRRIFGRSQVADFSGLCWCLRLRPCILGSVCVCRALLLCVCTYQWIVYV